VFDEDEAPIEDVMDEICSMFAYGYAPMEIVWSQRDDGNIGIPRSRSARSRPIYRWEIDEERRLD
jgi:hypothetical protein